MCATTEADEPGSTESSWRYSSLAEYRALRDINRGGGDIYLSA